MITHLGKSKAGAEGCVCKIVGSQLCFSFVETAGFFHPALAGFKKRVCKANENVNKMKNKGGRPKKKIRRDQQLAVMCTIIERKVISFKAKSAGVCISEFLRTLAVNGQLDSRKKKLPGEVLLLTGTLNHMAANLNQLARKRNQNDELNAIERAELKLLSNDVKVLAETIKKYLQ